MLCVQKFENTIIIVQFCKQYNLLNVHDIVCDIILYCMVSNKNTSLSQKYTYCIQNILPTIIIKLSID